MLGASTALMSHLVIHLTFFFFLVVQFMLLKREQEAGDACTQHSDSPCTQCERWQMQRKDVDGQVHYTPRTGQEVDVPYDVF